jgi:hypothetical protein
MIRTRLTALTQALLGCVLGMAAARAQADPQQASSPVYGVSLPQSYRHWQLIAPSLQAEPLNELRVIVGNQAVLDAYRAGTLQFPDGAILVKLAWKRVPSAEFAPPTIVVLLSR